MANYSVLKAAVAEVIQQNGNNEITGPILQQTLLSIITSLGANYQFAGVATPSTNPGTPDQNIFYICGPGTYANFGEQQVVQNGYIGFFKYNGTWTYESVQVGDANAVKYVEQILTLSQKTQARQNIDAASNTEFQQLNQEINGVSDYIPVELSLSVDQYRGVTSGGTKISVATTAREGTNCAVLECSPGDKFKIYGKGSAALRLYVFADSSQNILLSNSGAIDTRANGLEIIAPDNTVNLYINFLDYDSSTDKLERYTVDGGIISVLLELDNNALRKSDVVDNLESDLADAPLSARQGNILNRKIVGTNSYVPQTLSLLNDQYYPSVANYTMMSITPSARVGTKCCYISVLAGDKFRIYGKGTKAIKLYAFTDTDYNILLGNDSAIDTRTDGLELTAPAGSAYFFINFLDYDSTTDELDKKIVSPGLEQNVERLEQEIGELEQDIAEIRLYGGKKIIAFGDSITEFKWDGGDGKGWVDHAAEILGCEFVNVAIGGAHMNVRYIVELFDASHSYAVDDYVFYKPADTMNIYKCINPHSGVWNASDFEDESTNATTIGGIAYNPLFVWGMIQAFCDMNTLNPAERFKNQVAAAECIYTWKSTHDDNRAIVQRLMNTDPDDITAIVILHGANDYATYGYWGNSDSYDTTTLLGAINQSVKELNSVFKDKPIFYVTPPVRWFNYSGGTGLPQDFSDYYKRDADAPKTYKQFVYDILVNQYKLNHIAVCDLYGELQWTMWNFSEYFPSNDGTHPRPGFSRIGAKIASFLVAKNVLKP